MWKPPCAHCVDGRLLSHLQPALIPGNLDCYASLDVHISHLSERVHADLDARQSTPRPPPCVAGVGRRVRLCAEQALHAQRRAA